MRATLSDLSADGIREHLSSDSGFGPVIVLESVASTNDELRRRAAAGAESGTVVVADQQTAGRGRLGRSWHSPPGLGLYISVLFRPDAEPAHLTRWTLGAAVAACRACRARGATSALIEWPNDLMVGPRKLAGVLGESRCGDGRPPELVVGLGLNVNHEIGDFPDELEAGSLRLEVGRGILNRSALAGAYLGELGRVARLLDEGNWDELATDWEELAPTSRGREVRVRAGTPDETSFEGTTLGLDAHGGLRVRRESGEVVSVHEAGSVIVL